MILSVRYGLREFDEAEDGMARLKYGSIFCALSWPARPAFVLAPNYSSVAGVEQSGARLSKLR